MTLCVCQSTLKREKFVVHELYLKTGFKKKKRVALRQVGPGTLCWSACIWTNLSSNNKIGINMRLKITACTASLGNL